MYNYCCKKCYCCCVKCVKTPKKCGYSKKCPCNKSGVVYGYVPVKLCYKIESTSNPVFPKCCPQDILDNVDFSQMNNMCNNNNDCCKKDYHC